ncbi:MAG: MmgE/PrpD family protein [Proteobacteria bacterium]|nr:MmgE/PrpD family protein [Pseudomonadota bacterium]
MDIMATLVRNLLDVSYKDLPSDAVTAAKKSILDTIGVTIAGSSVKGCQLLLAPIEEWGGRQESTIAVFGNKVPCHLAALANGTMARALEIADVFDQFPLHPSASIVPACLAVAERRGNVNGMDFVTAVALGQDMKIRMALANRLGPIQSGRYNLFKIFPATGAVGRILGLDEEKLSNAMGIAFTHMVGDAQSAFDGAMTHYLQQGIVAKLAIEAVLLAQAGITGSKNVLQGKYGFYNAYEPNPNIDALTNDLGKAFKGTEISIKMYSACRANHEAIDLALGFVKDDGISPDDIDQITIKVNESVYALVCHPLDQKRHPKTSVDAQFSMPFAVAASLVKRDFFIDELKEDAITDEKILSIAKRITPVIDNSCQTDLVIGSTVMILKTKEGKELLRKTQFPKGNPKNPITMDECVNKFIKCTKYSDRVFSETNISRIVEFISELEKKKDMSELAKLLVPT